MAKTYRTPSVASLGAAEVMTNASTTKQLFTEPDKQNLFTTISVLDL